MKRWLARMAGIAGMFAGACVSPGDEVRGLADQPPLDCAVLITGGAFLAGANLPDGTFPTATRTPGDAPAPPPEGIPIGAFAEVLERARVFQRVALDGDAAHRAQMSRLMLARSTDEALTAFLARARADGYDYLLVVEELQNGPIEMQGTNGRWPVTFVTWILLGVGALIPDRTFESRATLRVTLRDLQSGRELHDPLLVAGPVELSLVERTDFWGLLESILVPPFWVGDDQEAVRGSLCDTTQRRLLLSLARDLKSESVRQRLRERVPADVAMAEGPAGYQITVRTAESLGVARLRGPHLDAAASEAFAQELLASVRQEGGRYRYDAVLPAAAIGQSVQVLVGTLRGGVASATFAPGRRE